MGKVNVYAQTKMRLSDTEEKKCAIHIVLDEKGNVIFVEDNAFSMKSFVLIHLMSEIYYSAGIKCKSDSEELMHVEYGTINKWCQAEQSLKPYPVLYVEQKDSEAKAYQLDKDVGTKWLLNPNLKSLVYFVEQVEKVDNEYHDSAYKDHTQGYKLLNPAYAPEWEIFFQEV